MKKKEEITETKEDDKKVILFDSPIDLYSCTRQELVTLIEDVGLYKGEKEGWNASLDKKGIGYTLMRNFLLEERKQEEWRYFVQGMFLAAFWGLVNDSEKYNEIAGDVEYHLVGMAGNRMYERYRASKGAKIAARIALEEQKREAAKAALADKLETYKRFRVKLKLAKEDSLEGVFGEGWADYANHPEILEIDKEC